jgi:hypothetical protein
MNEPFDITTPDGESPTLPEEIISIDIHVDLYAGPLPPKLVIPLLPAKVDVWSKFAVAFKNILSLPKPIGRLVFDILGRHDIADTSSVILGWFVVLMTLLLLRGFIPFDILTNWLVKK